MAPDGTAFIAGGTFSTNFPTTHQLQPDHGGPDDFDQDAFVAKISADGSQLLYSTYLGGKFQDVANGIAVDAFGNAYVTGTTISPDFPYSFNSFGTLCGGDGSAAPCGIRAGSLFPTPSSLSSTRPVRELFIPDSWATMKTFEGKPLRWTPTEMLM